MAAAVCDYRPEKVAEGKLRREEKISLDLVATPDIVAGFAAEKGHRLVVGFALETDNEIDGGKRKLKEKNLDLVVVNNPLREGAGFGSDKNSGHIIDRGGRAEQVPLVSKLEFADRILDKVSALLGGGS
jgi:phosphopantothenoylcysteine decarboxylase/phosphopantothenate--cysteine ligase